MEMMLSKNYEKGKVKFPCYVSRKYDGVPVIFYIEDGELKHCTRQGNVLTSIDHIVEHIQEVLNNEYIYDDGIVCVGELYINNTPFKDISGKARKDEPCTLLRLMIFHAEDQWVEVLEDKVFGHVKMIETRRVMTYEVLDGIIETYPREWEGIMIRSGDYECGKRSWNSMKYKEVPTVDLRVTGFTEAIAKDGVPKGMVGAVQCVYKHKVINVGPGKMTHAERKKVFNNKGLYIGRIAEVKYMPDKSYEKLRQPTYQCWRMDKDETNEETI